MNQDIHLKYVKNKWNSPEEVKRTLEYYKKGCEVYYDYQGIRFRIRESRVLKFLDSLNLKRHAKVLELGYGAGTTAMEVLRRGLDITGIDISQEFKNLATKNCKNIKTDAKFHFKVGNVENLDIKDNSFDCVLELGVLHYLQDPLACMKEAKRVLKPGGYFILTQNNKKYGVGCIDSPLKIVRALIFLFIGSEYELSWTGTFLLHPAIWITSALSPFSKPIKRYRKRLIMLRENPIKKRAFSFQDLSRLSKKAGFKILRFDGAGFYSKSLAKLSRKLAGKLDRKLQKANDQRSIPGIYKFGNAIVFLLKKPE